jgi:hypothetical protein
MLARQKSRFTAPYAISQWVCRGQFGGKIILVFLLAFTALPAYPDER